MKKGLIVTIKAEVRGRAITEPVTQRHCPPSPTPTEGSLQALTAPAPLPQETEEKCLPSDNCRFFPNTGPSWGKVLSPPTAVPVKLASFLKRSKPGKEKRKP